MSPVANVLPAERPGGEAAVGKSL